MSRFGRPLVVAALGLLGVALAASRAPAQFIGGPLPAISPVNPVPSLPLVGGIRAVNPVMMGAISPIRPVAVPTVFIPRSPLSPVTPVMPVLGLPTFNYYQSWSFRVGPVSFSNTYAGPIGYWMYKNMNLPGYTYNWPPKNTYSLTNSLSPTWSAGGYMTGGVRNPLTDSFLRDFSRAQQSASARAMIYDVRGYERGGLSAMALLGGPEQAAPGGAIKPPAPADVTSGAALNDLLDRIAKTDRQANQVGFVPPDLMAEVRFAGPAAADAANLIRRAGVLEFPTAFATVPGLRETRDVLEANLISVAAPLQGGKPADPARVSRLAETVRRAQEQLTPAINKDLPFEDATAARRFLNQAAAVAQVAQNPASAGLINPQWTTQGATVADLVRHMTKYKLRFGPVTRGSEGAYLALYQEFASNWAAVPKNEPGKK